MGLRPPGDGDAAAVPTTRRTRPLWRACGREHRQPWWFATRTGRDDAGRFDLCYPSGTAYWALSASAAIIEAATDPDQMDDIPHMVGGLQRLAVWSAEDVSMAHRGLANTLIASVRTLTGEIATIVPYDIPWAWADAFHLAGRNGVLYRARFGQDEAVALFGERGVPGDAPLAERHVAMDVLDQLPEAMRARVRAIPSMDGLRRAAGPDSAGDR